MADNQTVMGERSSSYKLVNAYDELVRGTVYELMGKMDMCKCERCFLDACAIVFNRQYTHFVTSREGELLSKVPDMNHSNHVELMVAVMDALRLVKNFPHHKIDEIE